MLGKINVYKIVLFLVKTFTHKFWTFKNDFAQFYIKLTILARLKGNRGRLNLKVVVQITAKY